MICTNLTIAIPTIIKYDLCINLIGMIDRGNVTPEKIHIVDNGKLFNQRFNASTVTTPVEVYTPDRNIGVAASWNYFLRNNSGIVMILNDDVVISDVTIGDVMEAYGTGEGIDIMFSYGRGFCLFLLDSNNITSKVGYFDEQFWPAYYEDVDFMRRFVLAGAKAVNIDRIKIEHAGSATLREQQKTGTNKDHDSNFTKNKNYYIKKWGGLPPDEKYNTPFNK